MGITSKKTQQTSLHRNAELPKALPERSRKAQKHKGTGRGGIAANLHCTEIANLRSNWKSCRGLAAPTTIPVGDSIPTDADIAELSKFIIYGF